MATSVTMPQLGESVVEGTIAKWLVAEGDAVTEDQALVEVTTDKIDTEIPSPAAGIVSSILVPAGETVKIGTVLCEIAPAAAGAKPAARPAPAQTGAVPKAATGEAVSGASSPSASPAASAPASQAPPAPPSQAAPAPASPSRTPDRQRPREQAAASAPRGGGAETESTRPRPSGPEPRAGGAPTARKASNQPGVALDDERAAGAREKRRSARAGDGNGGAPGPAAPRVTPLVRKMAEAHDVDLSRISGTGVGGRITKDDVLAHLELGGAAQPDLAGPSEYGDLLGLESPRPDLSAAGMRSPAPSLREAARGRDGAAGGAVPAAAAGQTRDYQPPVVLPEEGDRVEPFSKRRKIIAEHMVYSKAVSPHVYTLAEIDMSRVAALREAKKREFRESEGVNLTFLHFLIVAAVRALREVPRLNAVVGEGQLILRRAIHIGVAVETEGGLVVPVVKDADRLSLRGIAREVEDLATRARDRKLRLEDLQGGTFTISNPGREGNLVGFAVINQPQLGILRMGEVKKRPVVVQVDGVDAISIRPIMLLSLSYDHRVIDGVTGNSFLYRVKEHLEAGDFEV